MEEEIRRRQKEEQRVQAEQERVQQAQNAALNSVRQAAGMFPSDRYANQATRYRESSIASAVSPQTTRNNPGYDAVPHHPLQDPLLLRNELQETTTPIWQANHTPTATRSQPLYSQHVLPIDTSFVNGSVQYPQLMSAHQRAQGYQPSVMFPSPVTSRGGSSGLYNVSLPLQTPVVQYPPPRSSSFVQPQPTYSPAPPPPSLYPSASASSSTPASHYEGAPAPVRSQRNSQSPSSQSTHRRQSSFPEVLRNPNPLAMRPIDMPAELLDRFLGVARLNTLRRVETCGLLLGKERGAGFTIVTLLIPEQRGTQDTCTMESEELVVEFSTDRDLLTLGWVSAS
jgi:STAM-binding protein